MTKNTAKEVEYLDLGIVGIMTPIGAIEAIQKMPEYTMTCEVTSLTAELMRVKIDSFNNIIKTGSLVWQLVQKQTDEM